LLTAIRTVGRDAGAQGGGVADVPPHAGTIAAQAHSASVHAILHAVARVDAGVSLRAGIGMGIGVSIDSMDEQRGIRPIIGARVPLFKSRGSRV
jgi:hypothetical protein